LILKGSGSYFKLSGISSSGLSIGFGWNTGIDFFLNFIKLGYFIANYRANMVLNFEVYLLRF
jgi:hypothetical protein